VLREHGQRLIGSLKIARRKYQARKDIQNSKSVVIL